MLTMDRASLQALFKDCCASGWSLHSDVQLQEWLEGFAERLKGRINAVADEVHHVVEELVVVELDLENAFNSFRCLSSSQFVENRVYEEDETELVNAGTPRKDVQAPSIPTETYEDEILPRYKDAVGFAWAALQEGSCKLRQPSLQARSGSKTRDSCQDEMVLILPYIIGTEDFARDINCGLADLRQRHQVADDSLFDSDAERCGEDFAAEVIGSSIPSDAELSGTDSDTSFSQEGGFEPAFSAALDFKAMLEAALCNPSLPYHGCTLNDDDSVSETFGENKFSLPKLFIDNYSNSPRAISRRMESNDDKVGDGSFEAAVTDINNSQLHNISHLPAEISVSSNQVGNAGNFRPLLPAQDDVTYSLILGERLKNRFNFQAQDLLKEYDKQNLDRNVDIMHMGTSDLRHISSIPGGLFHDEESDAGFLIQEHTVLPNSNSEPEIPKEVIQRQPSLDLSQHIDSQSSHLSDSAHAQYQSKASLVNATTGPSNQVLDSLFQDLERKQSDKPELMPSSLSKHASFESLRSSISNGSKVNIGSQQVGRAPIRGSLFDDDDDDDDEDEDSVNLFRASSIKIESQPGLRSWNSRSSKGLFDDADDIDTKEQSVATWTLEAAGFHDEVKSNIDNSSSLVPGRENPPRHEVVVSRSPSFGSFSAKIFPGSYLDPSTSMDAKDIESNSQTEVRMGSIQAQLPIQSLLAASLRSTVHSALDSDFDDSWASCGSEEDDMTSVKLDAGPNITQGSPPELESDGSGANSSQVPEIGSVDEITSIHSVHVAQSMSSAENTSNGTINCKDGENIALISQTAKEAPSDELRLVHFPSALSSSFSDSETPPGEVATKLVNSPLLQSKQIDLSDVESDHYGSSSSESRGVDRLQLHPLAHSELQVSSSSQTTDVLNKTPMRPAQKRVEENSLPSEDVNHRKTSSSYLAVPVNAYQVTSGQKFTSLFGDDAEEDLFGQNPPKHQVGLFPGVEHKETEVSLDSTFAISPEQLLYMTLKRGSSLNTRGTTPKFPHDSHHPPKHQVGSLPRAQQNETEVSPDSTLAISPGKQCEVVKSDPSLNSQDTSPGLPRESNPSTDLSIGSYPTRVDNNEGDLSSGKLGSNLSSLLFGKDDDDNEDLLFGPLVGRISKGSNRLNPVKAVSFGDGNSSSSSFLHATSGRYLFDD